MKKKMVETGIYDSYDGLSDEDRKNIKQQMLEKLKKKDEES